MRGEGEVRLSEAADKEERESEDGMKVGVLGGSGVRGSEKGLGKRVVCVSGIVGKGLIGEDFEGVEVSEA